MLATEQDVLAHLSQGTLVEHRHENLELKESWDKGYGSKLCALANKVSVASAWMVVGVDDQGRAVGKDEKWVRQYEEVVSQQLNRFLDPVQACKGIRCHQTPSGWVIVIETANPGAVTKWENHSYQAAGSTESRMSAEEEMELTIRLPGLTDYSKQPIASACDDQLTTQFLTLVSQKRPNDPTISSHKHTSVQDALASLRIEGTQCARILFGPTPFRLVVMDLQGAPKINQTYHGLYRLLSREFRTTMQEFAAELTGKTQEPYADNVLRETLGNAVAHAAYFERNGEILIEIHPDRMSVSNLCLPESGAFANKWLSRARRTFNILLMETLRLGGMVDELGRGKSVIFHESILGGRKMPTVSVEPVGRFSRWTLTVYGGLRDERVLRLVDRLKEIYGEERKALVALALILWHNEPLSQIKRHLDGESSHLLRAVLEHDKCPIYSLENERLLISRWVRVLLGEGKDSKKLSAQEEKHLVERASELSRKYHSGTMTTAQFRDWAGMGDTGSERTLASAVLRAWSKRGIVESQGKGVYLFKDAPSELGAIEARIQNLMNSLGALASLRSGGSSP